MPGPIPTQQQMWDAMQKMQTYIEDLELRLDQADQDNADHVNMYAQRLTQLENEKVTNNKRFSALEVFLQNPLKLTDILLDKSLTIGSGDQALHINIEEGIWVGQNKIADIVGGAKGVAILFDGTWYQNP